MSFLSRVLKNDKILKLVLKLQIMQSCHIKLTKINIQLKSCTLFLNNKPVLLLYTFYYNIQITLRLDEARTDQSLTLSQPSRKCATSVQ